MTTEKFIITVPATGVIELTTLAFSQQQVEIIVRSVKPDDKSQRLDTQFVSGFIQNELSKPEEDAWNDL